MSEIGTSAGGRIGARSRGGRVAVAGGLLLLAAASALASVPVAPFGVWYYQFAWAGTLAALAGGLAWRTGRWPLRAGQAVSLFLWSAALWYLFEVLNLRLQNWYYVFVPAEAPVRWAGTFLAFTTVAPALYLASEWFRELVLAEDWRRPSFEVGTAHLAGMAVVGVGFVALALLRPDAFYPLVWGAVTLLLEPWNHRRDPGSSLLGDLSRGRYARIVRLLAGGAVIGVLWEAYNALGTARWIYTVPGLEEGKLFEMPVPGFLGFPVLALDAFVAYRALASLRVAVPAWDGDDPGRAAGPDAAAAPSPLPVRTAIAAALALALCAGAQAGVDRWTVDSVRPGLADLPGLAPGTPERLGRAGVGRVEDLAGREPAALARATGLGRAEAGRAVRSAELATLRGLGAENAAALWGGGVRSACDLARAEAAAVSGAVRAARTSPTAGKRARVRVWIRAAREQCDARRAEAGVMGGPAEPG